MHASLLTYVRRMLTPVERIYECRNCGTTLDEKAESCPTCESEEICEYHLR